MKIKRIATTFISMALLFLLAIPAFAQTNTATGYVISSNALSFLQLHKVDVTPFKQSSITNDKIYSTENSTVSLSKSSMYDESILNFKKQAAVYNFSDDQIQKFITGMVATPPTVAHAAPTSNTTISSLNSTRVDTAGLGYEVKSTSGFDEETAYSTIPTAYRGGTGTSGYMFYTVSPATGSFGIDIGLWYGDGTGGVGWRGVYNSSTLGQSATTGILTALTAGTQIYTYVFVRTDGYLEYKAVNATTFSTVYADFIYYVGDQGLYQTNGIYNRQITLCTDSGLFTNTSYFHNAKFSTAYLYTTTGNAPVTSSNTVSTRVGAFGAGGTTVNKVTVNSYSAWGSEDVSINFTNP
jgi:hypothetical protein